MKKPTVAKLKKKADKVFSEYIRQKYADDNGFVYCFTCGTRKHWKQMQNSHYVSRSFNSLRYSEENCHPACAACNIWKHGNLDEYALRLQEKYGAGILKKLAKEKRKIKQFTVEELQTLIKYYSSQ